MANASPTAAGLLDAKLLRLFDTLYSTGSVTRSAELLGQSQPTISIWLARLRRDLNDPLFVRSPSGMQPTPRADALIATLPRHIGETLAGFYGLRVLPCPVEIPGFTVKQHWHARYHNDAANRWLRGVCAELFQQRAVRSGRAG